MSVLITRTFKGKKNNKRSVFTNFFLQREGEGGAQGGGQNPKNREVACPKMSQEVEALVFTFNVSP